MRTAKAMAVIFLVAAFAVLLPRLAWTLFQTYVLGHPDGSFPARGGVEFVALFVSAAAAISGLVASVLAGISTAAGNVADNRKCIVSALIAGLILSAGTFLLPRLALHGLGQSILGDLGFIAVNWAAISAAVIAVTYAGVSRFTNNTASSQLPQDSAPERAPPNNPPP